jgi:membrane-associated phospholipid phosphatase
MKGTTDDRRIWVECAVLAGVSALLAVLMSKLFARSRPTEPLPKHQPGDAPAAPWEKPKAEEKARAEPARRALDQATAQVDSPEKASRVAERLEELAGSATTGEVEQARQPAKPGTVGDKVAESSQRIEQAVKSGPPGEKAANGIAQAAKEIIASPSRERAVLAEATQETLNPEQQGAPGAAYPEQREYLHQAVLERMKPFDALDAELFLSVNHLPHNRWLNGFFYFFTFTFSAGLGWYAVMMALAILVDPRRGLRAARHIILPLSVSSILVEYPIKAFFRRRRPFIDFIQAIVIGEKPGSWSFPSGHSASAFAGAWLLSREFPNQRPFFFLLAALVGFSRIYLGDHYPGDVLSGALSGMTIAEIVQRVQRAVERATGRDSSWLDRGLQ